jgi:hypothetical protein
MSISRSRQTHHAQKPSSDCFRDRPSRSHPKTPEDRSGRNHSSHITGSHPARRFHPLLTHWTKPPTRQDRSHASEPSPHDCWGAYPEGQLSRSDMQPNDGMSASPYGQASITRAQRRTRT